MTAADTSSNTLTADTLTPDPSTDIQPVGLQAPRWPSLNHRNPVVSGLVSVIMPAYNVAGFIVDALESVRLQTYPHWELIVVDDGSTDDTASRVKAYQQQYPTLPVRLLQKPNGGVSSAYNAGVQASCGEYLACLDPDDAYEPNALALMVDVLQQQPQVVAVHGVQRHMDEAGNLLAQDASVLVGQPDGSLAWDPAYLPSWRNVSLERFIHSFCGSVIRRQVVQQIGLGREDLNISEDYEFFLRLFLHNPTQGLYYLPEPVFRYRVRAGSLTRDDRRYREAIDCGLRVRQWWFFQAPIPGEIRRELLPLYGLSVLNLHTFWARERLIQQRATLTRDITAMAWREPSISKRLWFQRCFPLWLRSWLPAPVESGLRWCRMWGKQSWQVCWRLNGYPQWLKRFQRVEIKSG